MFSLSFGFQIRPQPFQSPCQQSQCPTPVEPDVGGKRRFINWIGAGRSIRARLDGHVDFTPAALLRLRFLPVLMKEVLYGTENVGTKSPLFRIGIVKGVFAENVREKCLRKIPGGFSVAADQRSVAA